MPQQTSTFESHFLTHMQGVAGAYHKLIACSWVPILQVGGLGKVRVNCFPKAITTWLGWESNPQPPDPESDSSVSKILHELHLESGKKDRNKEKLRVIRTPTKLILSDITSLNIDSDWYPDTSTLT